MPLGEVCLKESFDESEIEHEEGGVTEVPAGIIGGAKPRMDPVAKILQRYKKSTNTPLECLAESNNCSINKEHGYILDNSTGLVIKPSQLFQCLNLETNSSVRCPLPDCLEPTSWDLILWHFEDHGLSFDEVSKLFARDFYSWDYQDSKFRYQGEEIAV